MFRCVRSTWMIPSKAKLNDSMIEGGRRDSHSSAASRASISSPCS